MTFPLYPASFIRFDRSSYSQTNTYVRSSGRELELFAAVVMKMLPPTFTRT